MVTGKEKISMLKSIFFKKNSKGDKSYKTKNFNQLKQERIILKNPTQYQTILQLCSFNITWDR